MKNRAKNEGRWVPSVHVFAVGKDANAMLLHHTAKELGGTFWYISDASMAGSAGCTAIANFNTVSVTGVRINGIHVGSLRSGQPRHILVPASSEIRFVCDQIANDALSSSANQTKSQCTGTQSRGISSHGRTVVHRQHEARTILRPMRNPRRFAGPRSSSGSLRLVFRRMPISPKEHPMGKAILQDVLSPSDLERLGIARDEAASPKCRWQCETRVHCDRGARRTCSTLPSVWSAKCPSTTRTQLPITWPL